MNKIGFAVSGMFVLIGIATLFQTAIINLVVPKLGRIAFQMAMAGSYSPDDYVINFLGVNVAAVLLIGIGIALGYVFYRNR